jgi:diketogulonate reductase-like aldo/keto reductase
MNAITDIFKLNNGTGIPCVGFGTWRNPAKRLNWFCNVSG